MTRWGPVVLTVALPATVGCYSTFDLPLQSVQALDRFHDGEHRTITTTHGENVVFDRDTTLSFHDEGGEGVLVASLHTESGVELDRGRDREARFSAIVVNGSSFEGTTRSHERVTIDLRQVQAIQARKPSALKTTLAILIPCVLVTIAAFAIFFPVCQATTCFGTI
jgi:hypothetical protein